MLRRPARQAVGAPNVRLSIGRDGGGDLRPATSTQISIPAPAVIRARLGAMIAVEGAADLPPALLATIKHAASVPNPVFYERQWRRIRFCMSEHVMILKNDLRLLALHKSRRP